MPLSLDIVVQCFTRLRYLCVIPLLLLTCQFYYVSYEFDGLLNINAKHLTSLSVYLITF